MTTYHVLSLKQPWATLLAAGRKTIEIRRWQTAYRGLVLIHAARIADPRPEAWSHVPAELMEQTKQAGGIVGAGTLASVKLYRCAELFAAEQASHLNHPSWFEPAGLFGFCFHDLRPVPFCRQPGQVRLFRCELDLELPPAPGGEPQLADASRRRWQRILQSLFGPAASAVADPEPR